MNWTAIIFAGALALPVHAQNFQNLNFEQANPVIDPNDPYYPGSVTATSAFPHWAVTMGGVQQADVAENDVSLGAVWVSLAGPNAQYGPPPLDGNYSAVLEGGGPVYTQTQGGWVSGAASISQTGLIPAGTQTLLFEAEGYDTDTFSVTIGNQSVTYVAIGQGSGASADTLYAADISAWAGTKEQLTFSASPFPNGGLSNWELDDIKFSQVAVLPEPSSLLLTGLGGLIFALHRRFRRN